MTASRWERLRLDLAAVGIEAKVSERQYAEEVLGRVKHGVSRSIVLRRDDGVVEVSDTWWPKNPDMWTGWLVTQGDREGITLRRSGRMKHRQAVVNVVRQLLCEASCSCACHLTPAVRAGHQCAGWAR